MEPFALPVSLAERTVLLNRLLSVMNGKPTKPASVSPASGSSHRQTKPSAVVKNRSLLIVAQLVTTKSVVPFPRYAGALHASVSVLYGSAIVCQPPPPPSRAFA